MSKAKARVSIAIGVEVEVTTQPSMTLNEVDQKLRSKAIDKVWAGLNPIIWSSDKAVIIWKQIE